MKTKISALFISMLFVGALQAQYASDNFETGSFPNTGTGAWTTGWTPAGVNGGQFLASPSQIDGNFSMGIFGGGAAGTSGSESSTRTFTPVSSGSVTVTWSFKSLVDLSAAGNQIGFSILDGSNNPILTMRFVNGNPQLQLNDGGGDFTIGTGPNYTTNHIYDFSVTLTAGSTLYNFTAADRNPAGGSDFGNNFNLSRPAPASIGGVQFFANLLSGAGNDAHLDNVNIALVPEPATFWLVGPALLGGLFFVRRRRG